MSRSKLEAALALQIRGARLPRPVREFRFADPVGRDFRADFAWPEEGLLVEVSGGLHAGRCGGHTGPEGRYRDMRKLNIATLLGYRVLEFAGADISDGSALFEIETALGRNSRREWMSFEERMAAFRKSRARRRRRTA